MLGNSVFLQLAFRSTPAKKLVCIARRCVNPVPVPEIGISAAIHISFLATRVNLNGNVEHKVKGKVQCKLECKRRQGRMHGGTLVATQGRRKLRSRVGLDLGWQKQVCRASVFSRSGISGVFRGRGRGTGMPPRTPGMPEDLPDGFTGRWYCRQWGHRKFQCMQFYKMRKARVRRDTLGASTGQVNHKAGHH